MDLLELNKIDPVKAITIAALLALSGSQAQDVEINGLRLPQEVVRNSDEPIIDSLISVFVLRSSHEVRKEGRTPDPGVHSPGWNLPKPVKEVIASTLGRAASLRSLDALTAAMTKAFRDAGEPTAQIHVPEQDVSNGALQVVVLFRK